MILRDASPDEIDRILVRTHALWSDGLEPGAYREYIATLMQSEWGRAGGYRFLILASESGEPAAAVKLYRFGLRLDNELLSAGGIGAVFTLPERRRTGCAAELLRQAHRIMAERGDALSLLFSEIGADYYARHGYRRLPSRAVRIAVPAGGSAGRAGLRRMIGGEIDGIIRLREREDAALPIALVRDRACWTYLLARASMPTLWLGVDRWESRIMLAGDRGYLWSQFGQVHEGAGGRILEFAEAEPGTVLAPLLDEFFAECRRRGVVEAEAWLAPGTDSRDDRLRAPSARPIDPPSAVPMWLPLDVLAEQDLTQHAEAASFQLTDLF
ncbi:MAG TPA: GNAT family N-acetyltransferase [Candidatus Polarisedimenticolia bacterium]|nr:GNAT family N-acetyltransferase [Candidatus Polarisedimenticolia bacterium]